MKLWIIRVHALAILAVFYFLKPIAILFKRHKKKKIFMFCERGYDAQDNAFVLFNYLLDDEEFVCKYLITKNGSRRASIRKNDQIKFGSIKHLFYLNYCDAIVSTHYLLFIPCGISTDKKTKLFKLDSKIIFLQHGIAENFLPSLAYPACKVDVFSCTARAEYEYILNNYNHPSGVVKQIGMARFDKLFEYKKDPESFTLKTILIMPTWRIWIDGKKHFEETEYYKQWSSLLASSEFLSFLKDNNLKARFVLHSQFRSHAAQFKKFESAFVEVIDSTENPGATVQNLLIESDALVTDYSSVAFDFAFMNKPVFYFGFDFSMYFSDHYKPGFFNYEKDGFGPFVDNLEDLLDSLEGFDYKTWESTYKNRVSHFFEGVDGHCCERYKEILKNL